MKYKSDGRVLKKYIKLFVKLQYVKHQVWSFGTSYDINHQ